MSLFRLQGNIQQQSNVTVPVASPLEAALASLVVSVGNAAIALGAIGVSAATLVESASVGIITSVFLLANALHHKANSGS